MATAQEQASKFETTLIAHDVRYEKTEIGDRPMFIVNFGGGEFNFSHLRINVLFDADGESVQLATSTVVSIPAEKVAQALICCNKCNMRFRWIKLYIDDDNDLIAETDGIIAGDTVGDECLELLYRMVSICDDCYGDFMKAIWA